jgi:hypothetical protein
MTLSGIAPIRLTIFIETIWGNRLSHGQTYRRRDRRGGRLHKFRASKESDLHLIRVGNERCEIPDAVVLGG